MPEDVRGRTGGDDWPLGCITPLVTSGKLVLPGMTFMI